MKSVEKTDHLGNVRVVVSDRLDPAGDEEVMTARSYYPFGSLMPGRRYSSGAGYRYGFNGMEMDKEMKGAGNHYTTHFRQYDPRVGRWWSMDPKGGIFTSWSPYAFSLNSPIKFNDPLGNCPPGVDCGDPVKGPKIRPTDQSGKEGGTYGWTRSGGNKFHGGFDILTSKGEKLKSLMDGSVYSRNKTGDFGNYIIVKSELPKEAEGDVVYVLYAHLESRSDVSGEVKKGEVVGKAGRSGNAQTIPQDQTHVHIKTKVGTKGDSWAQAERTDPEKFLKTKFNEDYKPISDKEGNNDVNGNDSQSASNKKSNSEGSVDRKDDYKKPKYRDRRSYRDKRSEIWDTDPDESDDSNNEDESEKKQIPRYRHGSNYDWDE